MAMPTQALQHDRTVGIGVHTRDLFYTSLTYNYRTD